MKHTSEYSWRYDRTNSKGEKKFKHATNESAEDVMDYFAEKSIEFEYKSGAHMFWIYYEKECYSYYYTTGRWSRYMGRGYPPKHYVAKGIKDFLERFILKTGDNLIETH